MSTHNICFNGEIAKIIPALSLSSPLRCTNVTATNNIGIEKKKKPTAGTLLVILASDKALLSTKKYCYSSSFLTKTYVVVLSRSTLTRHFYWVPTTYVFVEE